MQLVRLLLLSVFWGAFSLLSAVAIEPDAVAKPTSAGLPENAGLLPQAAAAAMTVPDGFQVQLAAGEPMVHQPIAMAFDARGRLRIAEAHTYPVRAPQGQGEDRIVILEDTDQDGLFDARKVFVEGLNLVSGMELGFGGVWVGAAPYLMFLPDRDGDDRPDSAHYVGKISDHAWWGGRNDAARHDDTAAAGGGHAHCGAMIYLGDNWPDSYRGSILMDNIHGNRINNDILHRRGSGYLASHGHDFLFANDQWFRGINLKYALDGTVYLIDWYDKNACHRADQESWDRTNGRVYRISYGEAKTRPVDLSKESNDSLVALHLHKHEWFARMARKILQQRSSKLQDRSSLTASLEQIAFSDAAVPLRLRAIWTLQACGLLSPVHRDRLRQEQGDESEYLRAWAVQLDAPDGKADDLDALADLAASDPSPVVRLALASLLQRLPLDDRWTILEHLLSHAVDVADHNLPLMLWYATEPLVRDDTTRSLALAMQSEIPIVRQYIYRRAAADPTAINTLLIALGEVDNLDAQKGMLVEITTAIKTQGRLKMPPQWPAVYESLAASTDAAVRSQAQFLTVKFGDASLFPKLREIATNAEVELAVRRSAIDALISGKDPLVFSLLLQLLDVPEFRQKAVRGLAGGSELVIAETLVDRYSLFSNQEKADAGKCHANRSTAGPRQVKIEKQVSKTSRLHSRKVHGIYA
ncbi:DUF7133 domain-containing protein [Novipirellula artificiosorum]|uniref:DUF7133 domain-containing protein n=1 Tax=Novipirellula artificiosorum TaxID=2528016 RepID=A0A5C6DZZ2_9BACT|nr:hypothetical protein [Novipirellula artificiosorum]TWU42192.1 hypothetical protein Poly41_04880 [Novipirellula artificiosorum]